MAGGDEHTDEHDTCAILDDTTFQKSGIRIEGVSKDIDLRPVEGVNGSCTEQVILEKLAKFGNTPEAVTLWGTGTPMREFLWSEEMADASVHVLLNGSFFIALALKSERKLSIKLNLIAYRLI